MYENAKLYVNDTSELDSKIEEVSKLKEAYEAEKIKTLESDVASLIEEKKYKKAIEKYREIYNLTKDKAYIIKIEGVEDTWVDEVIANAEWYLRKGEFDKAKAVMAEAKGNIKDISKIEDEEERIDEFIPQEMFTDESIIHNIAYERGEGYFDYWDITDTANDGSMGYEGLLFNSSSIIGMDTGETVSGWREYFFGGEYDEIRGILLVDGNYRYSNSKCTMKLNIYLDGVLSYSSESITQGSVPLEISADLKGAQKVRLEWVAYNGYERVQDFSFAFVDVSVRKKYKPIDSIVPATPTDAE